MDSPSGVGPSQALNSYVCYNKSSISHIGADL